MPPATTAFIPNTEPTDTALALRDELKAPPEMLINEGLDVMSSISNKGEDISY